MELQQSPCRFDPQAPALIIIDQTKLPGALVELALTDARQVHGAIATLQVRGAPAIGIAAAFGAYLAVATGEFSSSEQLLAQLQQACRYLATARPTAVNLSWALGRMESRGNALAQLPPHQLKAALLAEAQSILQEDVAHNQSIARHGLSLLRPGMGLLTHCNAGPLATSRYGTGLGPILLGQEQGYGFRVYADETRPLLQGARLTAWELHRAGVNVTLCCDNMAASLMAAGKIDACLVGCDRVAANGDVANKIGTLGVAVLAKHFGIPFYVLGPTSTLDLRCATGGDIVIEQRAPQEVTHQWYARPMAPQEVAVYNPAFDVTPSSLVSAIITEKGIAHPPYENSLSPG